jgi:hypothetical protein
MSSNARMVLNEIIYDPNGNANSSLISLRRGRPASPPGCSRRRTTQQSRSRARTGTFSGLPLDDHLASRKASPRCGLQVIDLRSGDIVQWVRLEGACRSSTTWSPCLGRSGPWPSASRPMKSDEIRRVIKMGEPAPLKPSLRVP